MIQNNDEMDVRAVRQLVKVSDGRIGAVMANDHAGGVLKTRESVGRSHHEYFYDSAWR